MSWGKSRFSPWLLTWCLWPADSMAHVSMHPSFTSFLLFIREDLSLSLRVLSLLCSDVLHSRLFILYHVCVCYFYFPYNYSWLSLCHCVDCMDLHKKRRTIDMIMNVIRLCVCVLFFFAFVCISIIVWMSVRVRVWVWACVLSRKVIWNLPSQTHQASVWPFLTKALLISSAQDIKKENDIAKTHCV